MMRQISFATLFTESTQHILYFFISLIISMEDAKSKMYVQFPEGKRKIVILSHTNTKRQPRAREKNDLQI